VKEEEEEEKISEGANEGGDIEIMCVRKRRQRDRRNRVRGVVRKER
jgi:hypothetical protein